MNLSRRQITLWLTASSAGLLTACAHAAPADDLLSAIIRDNPSGVITQLNRGADPNARDPDGQPLLIVALKRDSLRAFDALMQSKRIKVEQRFPFGRRLRIFGNRRAAPEAALVRGVLPEIVDIAAADGAVGDTFRRRRDLQRGVVIALEAGIALQHFQRPLVLRPHPLQRLCALHLLQIEMGFRIGV